MTLQTSKNLCSLRSKISPFLAMDVSVAARKRVDEGKEVLHMELGEPAHKAPRPVREAAIKALEDAPTGYTPSLGLPQLRERIAGHYQDAYGTDVSSDRVVITTGSSAGFVLSFLGSFDVGQTIAITAPGYPAYRNCIKALGLNVIDVPLRKEDRYAITPEQLEAIHAQSPLDGLLIASPSNPSGTMMEKQAFVNLISTCERLGITFISDEIYHRLEYGARAHSALEFSQKAIINNSFSKYYCMTGWRIGWMVLPDELVRPVECLAQSLYISAPFLSQIAAVKAFDATDELEEIKAGYRQNRRLLLAGLEDIGFQNIHPVDGAFYAYADASRFTNDAVGFSKKLLDNTGVAATPGLDFDPINGHTMMRFSFAGSQQTVEKAIAAMANYLDQ